jgi:hypothetical protein
VITVTTEILGLDPGIAMLDVLPPEHAALSVSQELVIFLMKYAADIKSQRPASPDRTRLLERIYLCLMKTAVDAVEGVEVRLQ